MNKKLIAVAVAGALGAPGLALAQASSVQIYGTISYGPEMRSAGGGDPTVTTSVPAAVGGQAGGLSSVRTAGVGIANQGLGGAYIAPGAIVGNSSLRSSVSGSGSNWGLRGREDLGRGMYAGFQIETSIQGDAVAPISGTGSGTFASYRNTGLWLGTPIGEFGSGSWDTPWVQNLQTTGMHGQTYGNSSTSAQAQLLGGITPFASATYSGQPIGQTCAPSIPGAAGAATFVGTSAKGCLSSVTTFSRRQSNSIWYQSPNWSGFRVRGHYLTNYNNATTDTGAPNPLKASLWSVAGNYTTGPLYVGLGYEKHVDLAAVGARTYTGTMILGQDGAGLNIAQFASANMIGSDAHAWNFNARYTVGNGIQLGVYVERLEWAWSYGPTAAGVAPAISNVTSLDKTAYRLDVAYQTGPHTLGLIFSRSQDIGGATIGAGFNGNDTGSQAWQLLYGYNFSKRTSLFAHAFLTENEKNSASTGVVFNGITPAVGGDPKYYGLGLRHTF